MEKTDPGERIFDVAIQGNKVLDNFDIISESGETDREIIRTFTGVKAGKTLTIDFIPEKGNTLLSGIEIKMEDKTAYKFQ